ncbi:hypothetical protein H7J50_23095 [Mycobacterium intermedium]|uniref:hypothetical protein n=1 Tax=Mycobacterium intermedium TaxID=28445 RepID=UPI000A9C9200|nr:hypothetical protein [Mycobacterium intermedium]MCV6966668.1 hypothetical protein [Mycobacterium intermedium]
MTAQASWTLDELVRRVAVGLADPAYRGAPNGRVRELPDRRAVRWYTTTGLVDRPAMQGRTALYGPRQLLQVIAVKRRQAEGRSLAEIQAELAGATDETLRRVAAVPDEVLAAPSEAAASVPKMSDSTACRGADTHARDKERSARRRRFWAEHPAPGPDTVRKLSGLSLPGGAMLVLPVDHDGRPDEDDINAIHEAARPLLDLLADRGLLSLDERSTS